MYISHYHDLTRWPVPAARSAAEGKRFDRMDLTILARPVAYCKHFLNLTTILSAWFVGRRSKECTEIVPTSTSPSFRGPTTYSLQLTSSSWAILPRVPVLVLGAAGPLTSSSPSLTAWGQASGWQLVCSPARLQRLHTCG